MAVAAERISVHRLDSSASESDQNDPLEIIIAKEGSGRRKSSFVDEQSEVLIKKREQQRRETACRVHKLIADDKKGSRKDRSHIDRVFDKCGPDSELKDNGDGTLSRLLTKSQLSDMQWGVRELAKKLGDIKLKIKVKTILIITKIYDDDLIELSRELVEWLLSKDRDTPYVVYVEDRLEDHERFSSQSLCEHDTTLKTRLKYWNADLCRKHPQTFDFVVTLGGDGTVLYASWLFQRIVPPVLSFALGSLGFLTKFDFQNFKDTLSHSFRDGVNISLRLRLEVTVMRADRERRERTKAKRDLVDELIGTEEDNDHTHKSDGTHEILNDIVVDRGPNSTMSAIEVFGDDQHLTTVQADGICVATPTGSTAYNLAAGGSLCHPENPVVLLTAICAHTLSFRPIILPDTIVLRVGVPYDARTSSWASFDGRERVELKPGDYVTISASRFPFANVMPAGKRSEDWINNISRTLNWNSRKKQKAFGNGKDGNNDNEDDKSS